MMTESERFPGPSVPGTINRRTFLTGTCAAVATMKLIGFSGPARAAEPTAAPHPLSVGYIEGSDTALSLAAPSWVEGEELRVVPYRSTRGELVSGAALITVHGFYPEASSEAVPSRSVFVDVIVRDAGTGDWYPVYLWTHRAGSVTNRTSRASLTLPARRGYRAAVTAKGGNTEDFAGENSFGFDGMRLKRGIYLLGLTAATWQRSTTLHHGAVDHRYASVLMTVDGMS